MEINKIYQGDCLSTIKTFPDKSINCVITSPPYWQLRDYGWNGQWGLEKTYQEYLAHLWELMDEIYRVLRDDGSVWVNLGDTYASVSGGMKDGFQDNKATAGIKYKVLKQTKQVIPNKCLLLIPHRFAIGCIDRQWILRNDCIWAKRNGMPESVTDRFSKKHEYIFFMAKQEKYYFDLDGIRDKQKESSLKRAEYGHFGAETDGKRNLLNPKTKQASFEKILNGFGKNPGSVSDFWDIPTQPSSDKHYATFNTKLIDKPIIAGCPEGGIILDPFCGTATTLARAKDLKRNYIGIEGNAEYVKIGEDRLKNTSDILI